MTRRVHLLSSTADMGFTVQQVRPGYAGSEVWVREAELDRLREAATLALSDMEMAFKPGTSVVELIRLGTGAALRLRAALAALDGEDGE